MNVIRVLFRRAHTRAHHLRRWLGAPATSAPLYGNEFRFRNNPNVRLRGETLNWSLHVSRRHIFHDYEYCVKKSLLKREDRSKKPGALHAWLHKELRMRLHNCTAIYEMQMNENGYDVWGFTTAQLSMQCRLTDEKGPIAGENFNRWNPGFRWELSKPM